MQMDFRKALPDSAQQPLMPVNLQVRVQAALHEHPSAAKLNGLPDLFVNGVEIEDVAFCRKLSLERAIESAKGAVLSTEIGVIDVPINDVGNYALGMELATDRVSFHADADEIVGLKEIERL